MCGIFGFITKRGAGPDLARLKTIACVTEQRGTHAFGLAWLTASGRLEMFKRPGAASARLSDLDRCRDAVAVIGHCRFATHGNPQYNRNNHPHRAGSGWLVHNGMVLNHRSLIRDYCLLPRTECDSEVLGLLMARLGGSIHLRAALTAAASDGPLAMLGLWRRPARLVVVRRGKPLHVGATAGGLYFGSLPQGLPAGAIAVPDGYAGMATFDGRRMHIDARPIAG